MKDTSLNSWQMIGVAFFSLLYAVVISSPILLAGYYSDDNINGLVLGATQLGHQSIWDIIKAQSIAWLHVGRFFPVSTLGYLFFYYFHTIFLYQAARVVAIWLSILSVVWLIKLVTRQMAAATLVLFFIPLCWSIKNYHDALTSFGILLQVVTIFISLSLGFFIKGIQYDQKKYRILAMVFYLLTLCTYELGVITLFMIVVVAWLYRDLPSKPLKKMLPFLLISAFYFALAAFLRMCFAQMVYDGIQFGSVSGVLHAFPDQLLSGLPLSYKLFAGKRYFLDPMISPNYSFWIQVLPSVVVFLVMVSPIYFLLGKLNIEKSAAKILFWLGLCFAVLPAALVGVSQKYQQDIHFGVGYLPVYVEYVGFALLILLLLNFMVRCTRHNRLVRKLIACGLGLIAGYSLYVNHYVVRATNNGWQNPRVLVENALQHGLLASVPSQSVIYKHYDIWNIPQFYMQNIALSTKVVDLRSDSYYPVNGVDEVSAQHGYLLYYNTLPESVSGYVVLGQLKQVNYTKVADKPEVKSYVVTDPLVFVAVKERKFLHFTGEDVTLDQVLYALAGQMQPFSWKTFPKLQIDESGAWFVVHLPKGDYEIQRRRNHNVKLGSGDNSTILVVKP